MVIKRLLLLGIITFASMIAPAAGPSAEAVTWIRLPCRVFLQGFNLGKLDVVIASHDDFKKVQKAIIDGCRSRLKSLDPFKDNLSLWSFTDAYGHVMNDFDSLYALGLDEEVLFVNCNYESAPKGGGSSGDEGKPASSGRVKKHVRIYDKGAVVVPGDDVD